MPRANRVNVTVETPLEESFRSQQVAGMFGLESAQTARQAFSVELPDDADPWQIGAIVGPSGSGKSTVARHAYGHRLAGARDWPGSASVLDGFSESVSAKEITAMFTAVGFSSPPAWVKPYSAGTSRY